jgi:predicted esterase
MRESWLMIFVLFASASALSADPDTLGLARDYVEAREPARRAAIAQELDAFAGDIDRCLAALRPTPPRDVPHGLSGLQHFTVPGLKERYPEDHLYYAVPRSYDPARPTGLLIFMHGGGGTTRREAAASVFSKERKNLAALGPFVDDLPYVTVSPSAPWNERSSDRWGLDTAEEYLAAVITESEHRFAIDPDRIVLAGFSMGAMGAYHLGPRMADRFAAVGAFSGMWSTAYWQAALGTPFFLIHGATDAVPPGDPARRHRPKYTDVAYARMARQLLSDAGVEHVYAEHPHGHDMWDAQPEMERFCRWMAQQRRDPFQKRVIAATPADGRCPSRHNRWISILETGDGTLRLDGTRRVGGGGWNETLEQWQECRIEPADVAVPGGAVDATYEGDNRFNVRTQNVRQLALWLHPKRVDFSRPVTVNLNGVTVKEHVRPSLAVALESYERRRDWGLIYHARIVLAVPPTP